ncbi:MAG: hypothetical protein R3224_01650, partial [Balneolaceae bacterium]|nr:hypothetical protein [Balneolaceae bacterium]
MSNEEQSYSVEFKTKVAKEALEQDKKNLDRLSDKYDVPVSTILSWTVQLEKNAPEFHEEEQSSESEQTIADEEE